MINIRELFEKKVKDQYSDFTDDLTLYWNSYGRWESLLTSPYCHLSIVISLLCYPIYLYPKEPFWYGYPLSILPNLLGFTLGGYAILLAFGDEKFKSEIARDDFDGKPTYYMSLNGAFIHFIVLQSISIIGALLGNILAINKGFFAWLGFCVFIYALLSAVAAAFAILNTADLFQSLNGGQRKDSASGNIKK